MIAEEHMFKRKRKIQFFFFFLFFTKNLISFEKYKYDYFETTRTHVKKFRLFSWFQINLDTQRSVFI